MKKIFFSLLTIISATGFVFGVSKAFFSDQEVSKDNTFVAGAIDLKVDSEGHYNGMECVDEKWQTCEYTGNGPELLINGGFETPSVTSPQNWDIFQNGTSGLGWKIEWATNEPDYNGQTRPEPALQELHRGVSGWLPAAGDQYAELDTDWDGPSGGMSGEPALVKIYQNITTTVGANYRLSYKFSPRPNTSEIDNKLNVQINDDLVEVHSATGGLNTSWTLYQYEFEATSETTKVEFVGAGVSNSLGVFLDEVSLVEVHRVCSPSTEYPESCYSSWELKDLGGNPTFQNKFFHFSDIKPGDWGENTISLHVDNNDAYLCLFTRNFTDLEVEPSSESEIEAGDLTTATGQPGELGNYLEFIAWRDDGDNVWELDEELITGEAPVKALNFLHSQYPLFSPANQALLKNETKYLGVAWCFGQMTLDSEEAKWSCDGSMSSFNDAQTDAVSADIGFYAEQVRHNQNFTCDRLP